MPDRTEKSPEEPVFLGSIADLLKQPSTFGIFSPPQELSQLSVLPVYQSPEYKIRE